jgi:hypothetical protein
MPLQAVVRRVVRDVGSAASHAVRVVAAARRRGPERV